MISVIGIDPGETVGIALVEYNDRQIAGRTLIQVNWTAAQFVLESLLVKYYKDADFEKRQAEVEPFVTGQSAGTRGAPAELTRQLAFKFAEQLQMWGYNVSRRKTADVKPWATDKRLKKAGLFQEQTGMRHANDAARHVLYTAKHDLYLPDPLA